MLKVFNSMKNLLQKCLHSKFLISNFTQQILGCQYMATSICLPYMLTSCFLKSNKRTKWRNMLRYHYSASTRKKITLKWFQTDLDSQEAVLCVSTLTAKTYLPENMGGT